MALVFQGFSKKSPSLMWTSHFSTRRVRRFQRNKAFSISYIIWSYYLEIVDYFKGLVGARRLWNETMNSTSTALGKEHYIWLTNRRHNFSKTMKRIYNFGRKIWGLVSIQFGRLVKIDSLLLVVCTVRLFWVYILLGESYASCRKNKV